MTDNIIIMAGGASSRMKKSIDEKLAPEKIVQANQLSKGLIKFGGKPFLTYLMENILNAAFKNVFIITSVVKARKDAIEQKLIMMYEMHNKKHSIENFT